jgi:hypothetical protein
VIKYVQIDGRRANIAVANDRFPEYFNIDSIAVLLGRNGTGKTQMLLDIAEVLTSGTGIGDQGHWSGWDSNGNEIGRDAKDPVPNLGVVYFTPLPYRRPVRKNSHLIDASPAGRPTRTTNARSLRSLQLIADRLGVSTELIGELTYRTDIVRRLIVPRLIEEDCRLNDQVLDNDLRVVREDRSVRGAPDVNRQRRRSRFTESIERLVGIPQQPIDGISVALACLEHAAKTPGRRAAAVRSFLEFMNIATFEPETASRDGAPLPYPLETFADLFHRTQYLLSDAIRQGRYRYVNESNAVGTQFPLDMKSGQLSRIATPGAIEFRWINLSSGLLSLVEQFAEIERGMERLARKGIRETLVLIDEGDAYLHMDWQRQYITHLDHFLAGVKQRLDMLHVQALIATHSPIISGDFPSAMVQRLDAGHVPDIKTFGSSLDALVLEAFGTPSIGEYAAKKIVDLRDRFLSGSLRPQDNYLIDEIGDIGLREAVLTENRNRDDN